MMSWWKFSKDYVRSIQEQLTQKPLETSATPKKQNSDLSLSSSLEQIHEKDSGVEMGLSALNMSPDLLKAGPGAGGTYLYQRSLLNTPQHDNYIDSRPEN
jgi:hypothetical protein